MRRTRKTGNMNIKGRTGNVNHRHSVRTSAAGRIGEKLLLWTVLVLIALVISFCIKGTAYSMEKDNTGREYEYFCQAF